MRSADIWLVIGTRPEAIKMSPVAHALAARGLRPRVVFTGQQRLDPDGFGLDRFPHIKLGCPGQENPHLHVQRVIRSLLPLFCDRPDMLLVQGDTSSALGGALAGFAASVPVAHVEAGLRTHDPELPWPEEEYRTAIDAEADLLLAPTELAAANLHAEKVLGEIHVTGNSGIDALLSMAAQLPPPILRDAGVKRLLVTCHRRESWGEGLEAVAAALIELAARGGTQIDVILHPNRHVAGTMSRLLSCVPNIRLLEPCGYRELLQRVRDCDLILTDSGGIQEEAPALGTPLLVLRDKTERPEGIASGNARLVGTKAHTIVAEVGRLLDDPAAWAAMAKRSLPYGDGRAAPRIATIIEQWLDERGEVERRATSRT